MPSKVSKDSCGIEQGLTISSNFSFKNREYNNNHGGLVIIVTLTKHKNKRNNNSDLGLLKTLLHHSYTYFMASIVLIIWHSNALDKKKLKESNGHQIFKKS